MKNFIRIIRIRNLTTESRDSIGLQNLGLESRVANFEA